jgi:hypothetical protein
MDRVIERLEVGNCTRSIIQTKPDGDSCSRALPPSFEGEVDAFDAFVVVREPDGIGSG